MLLLEHEEHEELCNYGEGKLFMEKFRYYDRDFALFFG